MKCFNHTEREAVATCPRNAERDCAESVPKSIRPVCAIPVLFRFSMTSSSKLKTKKNNESRNTRQLWQTPVVTS